MPDKLEGAADVARTAFWPYDIFGYLMPGLVVVGAIWIGGASALRRPPDIMLSSVGLTLLLIGAAYVVGHAIAAFSSLVLERWILRGVLGYPTSRMFPDGKQKGGGWPWVRWLGAATFPGYLRSYSPQFRRLFDRCFARVFGVEHIKGMDEHDRFWLAWEYVSVRHGPGYRRATHFVELYGFNRNASASCFLCALLPMWSAWTAPVAGSLWTCVALIAGATLFQNYVKLLRRMNDEVYRAFVVAAELAAANMPAE